MATRVIGSGPNTRSITRGTPKYVGTVIGAGPGTRPVNAAIIPREVWTNCVATTKAGSPCKAHPVQGKPYCVGHMRQVNSES